MKKLLISLLLMVSASWGLLGMYQPAPGPLQLGDVETSPGVWQNGIIMQKLWTNNNLGQAVHDFDGADPDKISTYQEIMNNLKNKTRDQVKKQLAIDAICALEKTIMALYDERAYSLGSYKPWRSIFITGIRKNLFDADINAELNQLIDELYNLSKIASFHSTTLANRLWATAHSYRHWRRNMVLSCFAYLAADAYVQGIEKSTANQFYKGGLTNTPRIMYNLGSNMLQGSKAIIQYPWNYIIKPTGKFIFSGKDAFKQGNEKKAKVTPEVNPLEEKIENGTEPTNSQESCNEQTESKSGHTGAYLKDAWSSFVASFFAKPQVAPEQQSLWKRLSNQLSNQTKKIQTNVKQGQVYWYNDKPVWEMNNYLYLSPF